MSGFKFSDLIQPGEAGLMAFRRELERRRDAWSRPGYFYRGGGDLLLQHGEQFHGRPIPDQYKHLQGQQGTCFRSALHGAQQDASLTYCEGYYAVGAMSFIPHAWCVTPGGEIVDLVVTDDWVGNLNSRSLLPIPPQERWSYWGVRFDTDLVTEHEDVIGLGMLDRPAAEVEEVKNNPHATLDPSDVMNFHDWPILKVPYDAHRSTLGLTKP